MTEPEDRVDLIAPPTPEDPRNSADLLACARDGDATAWEELSRRYNRLVRSTVASFRLQEADAQDAVQNTWLRVMERRGTIRDPECLGGWLATTASRECLALIRRRRQEVPDDVASKQLVAPEEEPDVTVVASDAHQAVNTAVGELAEHRQVLIQHLLSQPDYSGFKLIRVTGMPQGSIGPTPRQAWQALRDTLEQRGFVSQSGADVVEDVKGEPTEGNRTGSYLLDDLLDKADQALLRRTKVSGLQSCGGAMRGRRPASGLRRILGRFQGIS
jgi:RNA polymerase sigma factor (sigma-70 family)